MEAFAEAEAPRRLEAAIGSGRARGLPAPGRHWGIFSCSRITKCSQYPKINSRRWCRASCKPAAAPTVPRTGASITFPALNGPAPTKGTPYSMPRGIMQGMNTSRTALPDALVAVQSLTTAQILRRLDELRAEKRALQLLLRVARARESAHSSVQRPKGTAAQ